jgi:hypothetical protein
MSESENFLARWSRLKHEAALEATGLGKPAAVEALGGVAEPPTPAFDPASLPSIESIDAATDIRPFLDACVPDELTRAALRSTWSADPAIRDFVGIAESQWDFNDPASIPGFGVHAAADCLGSLAAHGIGTLGPAVGSSAESPPMIKPPVSDGTASAPPEAAPQVTPATTDHPRDLEPQITHSHGGALPR